MKSFTLTLASLVVAALGGAACTVHQTEAPGLTGPSEFALSVSMTASPDTLSSGGIQQAAISVVAKDAAGAARANQTFRLSTMLGDAVVNYGTLSTPTVVTGSDGRATAIYTIPSFTPYDAGTPNRQVSVVATPVGTDYTGVVSHTVSLLVVPPPVPTAAPGSPTAALTASKTTATVGQSVSFDASLSMAEAGHSIVYYYWNFGDGLINEEHGADASHVFVTPGTYVVVLGIQDDLGRTSNTYKTIKVS
ncbi:MAG TPA: PKD domain-containing protein [Vicinamibacterales bacterium]|nr:PKD domain-containing protein [Vicinamibacterales bacterium]